MDFMTYQSSVKYSDVLELELADGLKELLMDYGFIRRRILKIQSDDSASILGIEDYVAKIICTCLQNVKVSANKVESKFIYHMNNSKNINSNASTSLEARLSIPSN